MAGRTFRGGVYMAAVLLLVVADVSVAAAKAVTPALGVRRFSRALISLSSPRQAPATANCQQSGCSSTGSGTSSGTGSGICCNGACVDVTSSVQSCGACNNACAYDRECCGGACVDIYASDARHCGACGRVCSEGVPCLFGMCGYGSGRIIIP